MHHDDDDDDDDLVTVDRFLSVADAEIARGTLEASGIDAVIVDENVARMDWGYVPAMGGIRVQVRRSDEPAARSVLRGDDAGDAEEAETAADDERRVMQLPPLTDEETCARCGSDQVFLAMSRGKVFAMSIVLCYAFALLLTVVAGWLGFGAPLLLLVIAYTLPFLAPIYLWLWPRKRCRNCNAEWRGRQRTA